MMKEQTTVKTRRRENPLANGRLNPMTKLLPLLLIAVLAQTGTAQTSVGEAQRYFERGMQLKPGDNAEAEFRRAIELDGNFVEAHRELQDLKVGKGESARQSVIQEYRKKVEANPESAVHHYLLARLLEGKEAEAEYRKAVELEGNSFWPRFGLLFHYHEAKEHEKADAELPEVVALLPQSTYSHIKLARGLANYQRAKEALDILGAARVKAGNDVKALEEIATVSNQISDRITSNLIAFLCYLLAALICAAFAGWTIKEAIARKTQSSEHIAGMVMVLYSCLWFSILCVAAAKGNNLITGITNPGTTEYLMLLCVAFWPTVTYHTALVDKSRRGKLQSFYRFMLVYFYVTGVGLAVLFSYAVFILPTVQGQSVDSWLQFGFSVFFLNFVLYGILSVIMSIKTNRQKPVVDPQAKAARRWELVLLVLFIFVFLPLCVVSLFRVGDPGRFLGFVSTLIPVPFIIVAFYYEARYAFMDVFIKKSTVVVLMVLVSGVYYLMVGKAASSGLWRNIRFAEWIILLPLICALPFMAQMIERWVDRYIFRRRRAPSEVLSGFSRAIRRLESQEQLVETAAAYIRDVFQAKEVWIDRLADSPVRPGEPLEAADELTKSASKWKGAVVAEQLADSDPWKAWLAARAMDVVTALRTKGEVVLYLALGRKQIRDPYLSGDIDLLNSLTDQLEFALETVRLERERGEQERRQQELKVLAGRAELKALRAQINPHFLFNALNTIASLIRRNPVKAEETVETLADVFRHALTKSGKEFIPLAEELEFIQAYLDIEKARFGDKLQVEINIQKEAEGVRIPVMVLQPLVENAVKHGVAPKVEGGKVKISARCKNGSLEMEVADDGVGFEPANAHRLYHDGLGVRSVRDRLRGIYGEKGCIRIESAVNQGTRIHISLPIETPEP